jgi:hypothetical protein
MKGKNVWVVKAEDNANQPPLEVFSHVFTAKVEAMECVNAGRKAMPNLTWWAEYTLLDDKEYALHLIDLMVEDADSEEENQEIDLDGGLSAVNE